MAGILLGEVAAWHGSTRPTGSSSLTESAVIRHKLTISAFPFVKVDSSAGNTRILCPLSVHCWGPDGYPQDGKYSEEFAQLVARMEIENDYVRSA